MVDFRFFDFREVCYFIQKIDVYYLFRGVDIIYVFVYVDLYQGELRFRFILQNYNFLKNFLYIKYINESYLKKNFNNEIKKCYFFEEDFVFWRFDYEGDQIDFRKNVFVVMFKIFKLIIVS